MSAGTVRYYRLVAGDPAPAGGWLELVGRSEDAGAGGEGKAGPGESGGGAHVLGRHGRIALTSASPIAKVCAERGVTEDRGMVAKVPFVLLLRAHTLALEVYVPFSDALVLWYVGRPLARAYPCTRPPRPLRRCWAGMVTPLCLLDAEAPRPQGATLGKLPHANFSAPELVCISACLHLEVPGRGARRKR